eukprot:TRINITY_DN1392_c0_g1_i1.p1 TRINITY_DN1392_c0_g1~~TRINITY_DN1392_c0_g1_i1.p1  ORF type:complete len:390 (-),score=86.76 TRINITY_DN1392_c0_g1_i1:75-1244(-)
MTFLLRVPAHRIWKDEEMVRVILSPLLSYEEKRDARMGMETYQNRTRVSLLWVSMRRVCKLWRVICEDFDLSFGDDFAMKLAIQKGKIHSIRYIASKVDVEHLLLDPIRLSDASRDGHVELVEYLLERKNCDPNQPSKLRPLSQACRMYRYDIVSMLLNDERVSPSEYFEDFKYAAEHNQGKIIQIFLEDGRLDPTQQDLIALFSAVQRGCKDSVEFLLADQRIDVSKSDRNWLMESLDYPDIFLPLSKRVEPDCDVLLKSVEESRMDIVMILCKEFRFTSGTKTKALKIAKKNCKYSPVMVEVLKEMETSSKSRRKSENAKDAVSKKSASFDGFAPRRGKSEADVSVQKMKSASEIVNRLSMTPEEKKNSFWSFREKKGESRRKLNFE